MAKDKGRPYQRVNERCGEERESGAGRNRPFAGSFIQSNERSPREEPHRTMHPVHRGPERQTKPDMAILLFRKREFRCKHSEAPQAKTSRAKCKYVTNGPEKSRGLSPAYEGIVNRERCCVPAVNNTKEGLPPRGALLAWASDSAGRLPASIHGHLSRQPPSARRQPRGACWYGKPLTFGPLT